MIDLLAYSSLIFAIACMLLIIVPYWQRKRHLMTTWTLFLLACANFVGISGWQAARYWDEFQISRYVTLSDGVILGYFVGVVLLFSTIAWVYFGKTFSFVEAWQIRRWPGDGSMSRLPIAIVLLALGVIGTLIGVRIPFLGQILAIAGQGAGLVAFAIVFHSWYRQRGNIALLLVVLVFAGVSLLTAVAFGTSRRPLLSLVMTLPILFYWVRGRYYPAKFTVPALLIAAIAVGVLLGAYSSVRHRYKASGITPSGLAIAYESAVLLPQHLARPVDMINKAQLGGDAIPITLGVLDLYPREFEMEPMKTLLFVVLNPVPRYYWRGKPEALGLTLPRDLGQWEYGYINWGPGMIGNFYSDGGFLVIPLYGILLGLFMRWFDSMLISQSSNPYVLGIFAGFSGQWIALPRGDVAVFSVQIIGVFLSSLLVCWLGRHLLGEDAAPLPAVPGA